MAIIDDYALAIPCYLQWLKLVVTGYNEKLKISRTSKEHLATACANLSMGRDL